MCAGLLDLFKIHFSAILVASSVASMCNGLGAGFPIQGSHVQNYWVAPRLTQPFNLPRLIK